MNASQAEYYETTANLHEFGAIVCSLLKELLTDADIQFHSIDCRVKDFESVSRKLNLKADRYNNVGELTDLLGVRVITYFPNDVDKVAEIIKNEFTIDPDNSVDKRKILEADQFGYLSLHFIAKMSEKRSKLTEYKRHANYGFELQIRSILQHTWAEIQHDLGYKSKSDLPADITRRFSRLAGLFELADEEFERLRSDISTYKAKVDNAIKQSPESLPINQSTLVSSYENEDYLNKLDKIVAKERGFNLKTELDPSYLSNEIDDIHALGITNIDELHNYAQKYQKHIELFAHLWLGRGYKSTSTSPTARGIGLFYLNYTIAAQLSDEQIAKWGHRISGRKKDLMKKVRETWAEVVKELGAPSLPPPRKKDA